jgi:transcriptional regulator GlxA family with amidase domain
MGVTFGRFELHQRLALAEHLLLSTNLGLAAIAGKCDFADVSHFHRTFAKLYGETPGRYRELARKGAS